MREREQKSVQQYLRPLGPLEACAKATDGVGGGGCGEGKGKGNSRGLVTFDLKLRRVPNLGGRVAGHTREIAGVSRIEARNAEEARVRIEGRNVNAQVGRQGLAVL